MAGSYRADRRYFEGLYRVVSPHPARNVTGGTMAHRHRSRYGALLESISRVQWRQSGRDYGWRSAVSRTKDNCNVSAALSVATAARPEDRMAAGRGHFVADDHVCDFNIRHRTARPRVRS